MNPSPNVTITSPFPESHLPAVYLWLERFIDKSDYAGMTLQEFMDHQRARADACPTWIVYRDDEPAGFVELEASDYSGLVKLVFKQGCLNAETSVPGLSQILDRVFESVDVAIFEVPHPRRDRRAGPRRQLIAGALRARIIGASRDREGFDLFGITAGDWLERRRELLVA